VPLREVRRVGWGMPPSPLCLYQRCHTVNHLSCHIRYIIYTCRLSSIPSSGCRDDSWRGLCEKKHPHERRQFLGGVKKLKKKVLQDCHPGSSGILLAYRYILAKILKKLDLLRMVWYFFMTILVEHCPPPQQLCFIGRSPSLYFFRTRSWSLDETKLSEGYPTYYPLCHIVLNL
jgi:hypothetical protein